MIAARKRKEKKRREDSSYIPSKNQPELMSIDLSGWAQFKFFEICYMRMRLLIPQDTHTQTHGRKHSSACTRRSKSPDLLRRPVPLPLQYPRASRLMMLHNFGLISPIKTSICTNHHILTSSSRLTAVLRSRWTLPRGNS